MRVHRSALIGLLSSAVVISLAGPVAAGSVPVSDPSTVPAGEPGTDEPVDGEDTGIGPEVTVPMQEPPLISQAQVISGPLIVVPTGCAAPSPPKAVFVGTLELTGFMPGTVLAMARFTVSSVRAGSLDGYQVDRSVDVLFDEDTRFLEPGKTYLVGAAVDPVTQLLTSKVREPAPLFGGDAVIGLDDSDVECPQLEDPVRTLWPDGSAVDSGIFTPLTKARTSLARAVLLPLGIAFVALVAIVVVKLLAQGMLRALFGRHDPVPVHRPRRHRTGPA